MLFFFNFEKHGHLEIECHEGNETKKLIEKEDSYEEELIIALDELREENKSLKKELMKQKVSIHIFLRISKYHRENEKSVRRSQKDRRKS
jgi:hypothetical protein